MMPDSVTPLSHGGNTARDSWAGTVFLVVLSATVTYTVLLMAGSFGAPGEEPLLPVQINPRFAVAGFAVGAAVIYSVNSAVMWCAKKAPGTTYILALVFCMLLCFADIIGIAVDKVMLPDVKPSVMIIPIEIIVICVLFLVRAKKQLPLIQELLRASFSATAGLRWLPLDVLSFAVSAASLWATCAIIASILHHGAAAAIVISLVLLWSLFTWVFCLSSASTRVICTWYTGCGAPLPANAPIASLHRAVTVQLGTHALRAGILLLHIASCWTLALVSFLLYQLRRCSVFENGIIVRFARQMLSPLVAHSQLSVAMDASASEAAERALLNFKRDVALMKRLPIDAVMVGIAPVYGIFMLVSMLSRMFPSVDVAVFAIGALFALTCNTSSGVAVTTTMQTLRLLYSNSVSTFAVVLPEANRLINEISGPLPAEFAAEVEMAAPAPEGVVEGVVVEVAVAEKAEKEAA